MKKFFLTICLILFTATSAFALTPIARTNVVPRQWIEYGESLTFGVIAFSKAGIDRVEFAIDGQSYSGGTKTATSMTLNTRHAYTVQSAEQAAIGNHTGWPGVYEYYVTISASEFTTSGAITVTPTVYGDDAGTNTLDAVTLFVDPENTHSPNKVWVDASIANEDNSAVGSRSTPYKTIETAFSAAMTAYSTLDDVIIYLEDGEYNGTPDVGISNSTQWLVITAADGASSRDSVIISSPNGPDWDTNESLNYLKFENVTLMNRTGTVVSNTTSDLALWIHQCRMMTDEIAPYGDCDGGERAVRNASGPTYFTNTYATFVDRTFGYKSGLARNCTSYNTWEDGFTNPTLVVNIRMDDVDPYGCSGGETHSDVVQTQLGGVNDDMIVYNLMATKLHYQGLFLRSSGMVDVDNSAFVNCFIEMREPRRYSHLISGALYVKDSPWNHVIFWHNTFEAEKFNMFHGNNIGAEADLTNISFIGNIWYEAVQDEEFGTLEGATFEYGNSENNEVLWNHYNGAASLLHESNNCRSFTSPDPGCPSFRSVAWDSSNGRTTYSHGGMYTPTALDLSDTTNYSNFGVPDDGADDFYDVVNRMTSNVTGIPHDVYYNLRDSTPDIGAVEYTTGQQDTTEPSCSIADPVTALNTTYDNITITGVASDDTAVTTVSWGCPTCTPTSGACTDTTSWSCSVSVLGSGDNTITITASDAATNEGSDSVVITRKQFISKTRGVVGSGFTIK